jgi:hypothetical protein
LCSDPLVHGYVGAGLYQSAKIGFLPGFMVSRPKTIEPDKDEQVPEVTDVEVGEAD